MGRETRRWRCRGFDRGVEVEVLDVMSGRKFVGELVVSGRDATEVLDLPGRLKPLSGLEVQTPKYRLWSRSVFR